MTTTTIPDDWPVQPVPPDWPGAATCGACGLSWDDSVSTGWTPAPSGRCPFENFHPEPDDVADLYPCEHGHFDCATDHDGGLCSNDPRHPAMADDD